MPELPEVETVLRTLSAAVTGRTLRAVRYLSPLAAGRQPEEMSAALTGRRILEAGRKGKYLLFRLDQGWMTVHLRMTGSLLLDGERTPWTRVILELDNGHWVLFDDPRQFGRIEWSAQPQASVTRLGPDALDLGFAEFEDRLRSRKGRIKPLLLNQQVVCGIGNIYADEALHRARIHPLASVLRLSGVRLARLHTAIGEVLAGAIAAGGSSVSDYVDAEGRSGWFQTEHRVYGREGEACVNCGTAIKRTVVAQRGTHFCPRCQRA